ncbi:MAG: hypothetical protein IPG96_17135 [Proteobacteria bacterium]|nr:hypothetical protein [Pseudomonadota bacterium]
MLQQQAGALERAERGRVDLDRRGIAGADGGRRVEPQAGGGWFATQGARWLALRSAVSRRHERRQQHGQ